MPRLAAAPMPIGYTRSILFIQAPLSLHHPIFFLSSSLFTAIIQTKQLIPPRLGWPETYEYLVDVLD